MKKEDSKALVRKILKIISLTALVYSIVISSLMLFNYCNLRKYSPLESEQILGLIEKIDEDPQNQDLKETYRSLNFMARKAFFTAASQINTGRVFLIIGIAVFFFSFQLRQVLENPAYSVKSGESSGKKIRLAFVHYSAAALTIIMLLLTFVLGSLNIGLMNGGKQIPDRYLSLEKNSSGYWNCFRNSARSYTIPGGTPLVWDSATGQNIAWKKTLELPGFSSPVIWKDQIFLSSADSGTFRVESRDIETGDLLWKYDIPIEDPESLPFVQNDTGFAAPTPAVSKRGVFSIFATGLIAALDHSGNQMWTLQLTVPDNHYGHSSSLIVYDGMLFVQYDTNTEKYVLALNEKDGSVVWKTERNGNISWASPILAEWKEKVYLLLNSSPFVSAYEPYSGALIWETQCLSGEVAPSPAFSEGIVSAAQAYSQICSLDVETGEILWTEKGALPDVSSPVSTGSFLFIPSTYGTVTALNLADKSEFWFFEQSDGFYSSPVIINDRVYISDLAGHSVILAVSENMETVGGGDFDEPVYATPAASEKGIVYRTDSSLYLVAEKGGSGR